MVPVGNRQAGSNSATFASAASRENGEAAVNWQLAHPRRGVFKAEICPACFGRRATSEGISSPKPTADAIAPRLQTEHGAPAKHPLSLVSAMESSSAKRSRANRFGEHGPPAHPPSSPAPRRCPLTGHGTLLELVQCCPTLLWGSDCPCNLDSLLGTSPSRKEANTPCQGL